MWPFGVEDPHARRRTDRSESEQPSWPRPWLPGVAVGAITIVLLAVFPAESRLSQFAYLSAALLSLVLLLGAALVMPKGTRAVWWLLWIFEALVFAAIAARSTQDGSSADTFPSWADALQLAAYVPVLAALAILNLRLRPARDRAGWIDSSILTVAVVSIAGLFLISPVVNSPASDSTANLVTLTYIVLDVVLACGLIWLLVGGGRPSAALGMVASSVTLTLAAGLIRDVGLLPDAAGPNQAWLDLLPLAALMLMAAAATSPSAETVVRPNVTAEPRVTTSRLTILAIGVIVVPVLVAVRLAGVDQQTTFLLVLSSIIILILAVWRIQVLVTDVDQQRHVTELVLDSAGDGILGMDRQGFVLFANLAARRMLRCRESDLVGRRFHDVAHHEYPDGRSFPWQECPITELAASGGEAFFADQVYLRRDGTRFPVEIIMSPLVVDGVVMGAVQSFRDVSERHAVDEMKRHFISVVSHELRTPLTSIKGSLQMLDSGILGPVTEDQQELLTMAVTNSERLGQLVNDILDLERLDEGRMPLRPELVDAAALADQAVSGMRGAAGAAGIRLQLVIPDENDATEVEVDPHRMLQVLTNLLGNAIKFSDRGAAVRVVATRKDSQVRVAVSDHGRGIPADQLEHVFDRFGQVDVGDARRQGGSGLGLAIAREIVNRSGGTIEVASTMGLGSTFTVVLPAASTAAPVVDEVPADLPGIGT